MQTPPQEDVISGYLTRLKCRNDYFLNRVLNDWNSLPNYTVNAESVNSFKSLLDSYLINSGFICA